VSDPEQRQRRAYVRVFDDLYSPGMGHVSLIPIRPSVWLRFEVNQEAELPGQSEESVYRLQHSGRAL
jgi:hypothetical protein